MSRPDRSELQSSVLSELDELVFELRGRRAPSIELHASLERDLGLGSLERVELMSRLERRFRARFPERALRETETPSDLVEALLNGDEAPVLDRAASPSRPTRLAPPSSARSLAEVLVLRAEAEPDGPHVFLREDDAATESTLSFVDLYSEALTLAGGLHALGIERGDRVAIMLPTSRDFFVSFMGTLLAGAVPVPLYPPFSMKRLEEYVSRQSAIVSNAGASVFITVERGLAVGEVLKTSAPALAHVVTPGALVSRSRPVTPVIVDESDAALIQYTSGSTGDPKGVLLSHGNLLANIRAIGKAIAIEPHDVGVSWLPLYHDMGLIGAWLTPLYFGIPVAILSPLAFLARPSRWLTTIHTRRGTISPAPNFAYELCTRKIDDDTLEGLDLSSWRVALNGAEPISAETLERFTQKFEPYGFAPSAMLPVYGLAESALLVASSALSEPPRVERFDRDSLTTSGLARAAAPGDDHALRLVSVGQSVEGHDVAAVDEEGRPVEDGREGSLWFRGPSSMQGYYGNAAATAAVTRGRGFLDSGDRGFRFDGQLFITGRSKDIIIRAGRNLMPHEIESAAASVDGIRAGCVAAFGVPDERLGTERIVVVAEARDDVESESMRRTIDERVLDRVGSPPDDVVLLPPRTIPKTSSGKIRRSATRDRYVGGELGHDRKSTWSWWLRVGLGAVRARARHARARLARLGFGAWVSLVTALFVVPGWLLAVVVPSRRFFRAFVHQGARVYLWLTGIGYDVEGDARLDSGGPFVIAANHASYLDAIPMMAALPIDYAFVVKREALSWPVIGTFIRRLAHLPVERVDVEQSVGSTEAMRALLEDGRSLVLFPEGTFSYATGIRPFKLGAFQLAAETGRPLVPVALVGTRRWLRDGSWIPRRSSLKVIIGEPLSAEDPTFSAAVVLKEKTAELIASEVGEPRLDLVTSP